ncbi:hypothetical protein V6N12_069677 [Hibiscus sabdariffa]|uniref:Uncharacterized protein n=1 Tax=Hibiscus sabdariffa TaxID=183260 RepID=A0ABR2FEX6_9ROSI
MVEGRGGERLTVGDEVCLMGFDEGCARFRRAEWCLVLMVGGLDGVKNGEVLVRGCWYLARGLVQCHWCSMKDGMRVGRWCKTKGEMTLDGGFCG